MKILLISIIALVIPLFFVFVLGSSLHSKLAQLRNRYLRACERAEELANGDASTKEDREAATRECSQAARDYDAARSGCLARLVALLFGFREVNAARLGKAGAK